MPRSLLQQRVLLFSVMVILAALTLILVWPFVVPILTAFVVVVIMKPVHGWLLKRRWLQGKEGRAAGVTIVIFLLAIAIPAALITLLAISQATSLREQIQAESFDLEQTGLAALLGRSGLTITIEDLAGAASDAGQQALLALGKSLPFVFASTMVILVLTFVLLPRYKRPGKQDIFDIIPLPPEITQLFLNKADMMITAMFKGTFIIAIVSGIAMGIVLQIAGVPYAMLLTLLSMLLALLPLIGISLIAWPVGILLILNGQTWQGVFVIAAFVLVVGNIDNILRPLLVPKGVHLSLALIILSVLGGISLMGIIGVFYGPVIMILLVTSIDVYTKYMLRSDLEILQAQGRIDLKALGLEGAAKDQFELGALFMRAVKSVSARLRRAGESSEAERLSGDESTPGSA